MLEQNFFIFGLIIYFVKLSDCFEAGLTLLSSLLVVINLYDSMHFVILVALFMENSHSNI